MKELTDKITTMLLQGYSHDEIVDEMMMTRGNVDDPKGLHHMIKTIKSSEEYGQKVLAANNL